MPDQETRVVVRAITVRSNLLPPTDLIVDGIRLRINKNTKRASEVIEVLGRLPSWQHRLHHSGSMRGVVVANDYIQIKWLVRFSGPQISQIIEFIRDNPYDLKSVMNQLKELSSYVEQYCHLTLGRR